MFDTNELNWEDYEAITQYIYGALGAQYGIRVKGYGRNCKINGKSGVQHQIDVLTEQLDGEHKVLTAIECKYAKKKVDKDIVMKLSQIMQDSGIASGIIVCKAGFTKDAVTFAAHQGIKLVELREAVSNDAEYNKTVDIGILDMNFNVMRSRGEVVSIDFGTMIIAGADQISAMWFVHFYDSTGRAVSFGNYLKSFSEELQQRGELLKTTTIDYPLNSKLIWRQPDREINIEKIAITGFFSKTDMSFKKSFQLTDQVWLIMIELFDERKVTLSKSGLIWNLPPERGSGT
jgi:hypothetical protein